MWQLLCVLLWLGMDLGLVRVELQWFSRLSYGIFVLGMGKMLHVRSHFLTVCIRDLGGIPPPQEILFML